MNEIPTIYVDEAGYTGNDLLNPDQPFYVLGSVDLSEEESQEILFEMRAKFKLNLQSAQELKGNRLSKTTKGRNAIKWVQQRCQGRFHVVLNDKKLALAGKFFETLIEPTISSHNLLFYRMNFHRFITSIIYLSIKTGNRKAIEAAANFQGIFVGERIIPSSMITEEKLNISDLLEAILYFCRLNEATIADELKIIDDNKADPMIKWFADISLTSLNSSLVYWGKKYPVVDVICDESNPFSENQKMIEIMERISGPNPLDKDVASYKINTIKFGKSHEHASLQVADLIASYAGFALRNISPTFLQDWFGKYPESISPNSVLLTGGYIGFNDEERFRHTMVLKQMIEESQNLGQFKLDPRILMDLSIIWGLSPSDLTKLLTF